MSIADLRHRVTLCRQEDVVLSGGEFRLARSEVMTTWARIEEKAASTFSPHGAAIKDNRDARTHVITMRYRSDLNLSVMAWLYEARMKSSPRWFKVLSITQGEDSGTQYLKANCRLVERGDDLATPKQDGAKGPVQGLPHGVLL